MWIVRARRGESWGVDDGGAYQRQHVAAYSSAFLVPFDSRAGHRRYMPDAGLMLYDVGEIGSCHGKEDPSNTTPLQRNTVHRYMSRVLRRKLTASSTVGAVATRYVWSGTVGQMRRCSGVGSE